MSRRCLLACLFGLVAFTSCSLLHKKPPEPMFRCVVKELPPPGSQVAVWAIEQHSIYVGPEDSKAEQETIRWLQEHGLIVVRRSLVEQALEEQGFSQQSDDASALLKAGKLAGAKQMIVLQAYADRVMVRGVNTETGAMMWSGTGQYGDAANELEAVTPKASLTSKTLDAVWKSQRRQK